MRQATLSAVKSFGFALVYISKSYLIVCTFLPIKFPLSVIYGRAGAGAFKEPELSSLPCRAGTHLLTCTAAWTTSLLLLENRKLGPNPRFRDIVPEGIGRSVVKPWVGFPNVHPCYDLLPYVFCSRAGVFLPFCLCSTRIAGYVPKLCWREGGWLLSNCFCTEQRLGWQHLPARP